MDSEIGAEEWLAIFGHDAKTPCGYLRERARANTLEPV